MRDNGMPLITDVVHGLAAGLHWVAAGLAAGVHSVAPALAHAWHSARPVLASGLHWIAAGSTEIVRQTVAWPVAALAAGTAATAVLGWLLRARYSTPALPMARLPKPGQQNPQESRAGPGAEGHAVTAARTRNGTPAITGNPEPAGAVLGVLRMGEGFKPSRVVHGPAGHVWVVEKVLGHWRHPATAPERFLLPEPMVRWVMQVWGPLPDDPARNGEFVMTATGYGDHSWWWLSPGGDDEGDIGAQLTQVSSVPVH